MTFSKNEKISVSIIVVVFGIIYALISLYNHYNFRTNALDLGLYNNAFYDFSHLKMNTFKFDLSGKTTSFFGAHLDFIVIILSPLAYLFGSYASLVVQIIAILFGGIGVYKYAKRHIDNLPTNLMILIYFYSLWGIYSALSYDFHTNVIGAMFVPWFIYYYEKGITNLKTWLFFFLILISKENMALWLIFIILGLSIKNRFEHYKSKPVQAILLQIIPILYFIIGVSILLPLFNKNIGTSQLDRYGILGNNLTEIVSYIFSHPWDAISLLWKNTTTHPDFDGIKQELHLVVLFSGGIFLLFRPIYLIMLIPVYAQKMFSGHYIQWGINAQYSIEFAAILPFVIINTIKSTNYKLYIISATLFSTILINHNKITDRVSKWYSPVYLDYLSNIHYDQDMDLTSIYDALKVIPENASVSTHNALVPHLAMRDNIYLFPKVEHANYIALFKEKRGYYPISKEEFDKKVEFYSTSKDWQIEKETEDLIIFKRK